MLILVAQLSIGLHLAATMLLFKLSNVNFLVAEACSHANDKLCWQINLTSFAIGRETCCYREEDVQESEMRQIF